MFVKSEYKVWQSKKSDRWHWHLKSGNHKIISSGQSRGYATEQNARKGIRTTRINAPLAKIVVEDAR